jgi:hypothetical protein
LPFPGDFAVEARLSALRSWRIGGHADLQVGELSEHFTIFTIQLPGKLLIVDLG